MKITALLATAVAVAESRLYVQGGGWQVVQSARLPAVIPNLGVGIVADFEAGELTRARRLALRIRDASRHLVALTQDDGTGQHDKEWRDQIAAELPPVATEDQTATITFTLAFNIQQVTLAYDTPYEVEIVIDDEVRELMVALRQGR